MPYIKEENRKIAKKHPRNAGELNYAITSLILMYWATQGGNYQSINDISGACTEALAEFRRRVVGKYEDQKIKENGDVYP